MKNSHNLSSSLNQHIVDNIRDLVCSEEGTRSMVKALAEGIIYRDADKMIRSINASAERILGIKAELFIGQKHFDKAWETFDEDGYPIAKGAHPVSITHATGQECHDVIIGIFRPQKSLLWISINSEPVLKLGETKPYGIVSTFTDITERKENKEQLELSAKILENIQEGIMIFDLESAITSVNPAFCNMTGYSKEELVGKHIKFLIAGVHEANFYNNILQKLIETGKGEDENWLTCKNGQELPVWLTASVIKDNKEKTLQFVAVFRDITERKKYEQTIKYQAYHDSLTDLPNRLLFKDRIAISLAQAKRKNNLLAIMFLDFDNFKYVNDTFGHTIGDKLLIEIAKRLLSCVRSSDTVARLGGDEFTLILPDINKVEDINVVANKIIQNFNNPFYIDENCLIVTVSIGISYFPIDGEDVESLIRKADTAMYHVKAKGNDFQFYNGI